MKLIDETKVVNNVHVACKTLLANPQGYLDETGVAYCGFCGEDLVKDNQ